MTVKVSAVRVLSEVLRATFSTSEDDPDETGDGNSSCADDDGRACDGVVPMAVIICSLLCDVIDGIDVVVLYH